MQQSTWSSPPRSRPPQSWVYAVLGDQNFTQQRGFFAWWYRLTSLPDAPPEASFAQRDRVRRSRLASALMLFLLTVLLLAGAIGARSPNHTILFVVLSMLAAMAISIPINRHGGVEIVGLLMILGLTVGMYSSMAVDAFSVGMSPNDKDILYLLFFSDLFAGALLPVNWVFLVALLNIAFSIVALRFLPHDAALALMLKTSFPVIFPRLVQIHIIASGVMWILVNNLKAALHRADRAEEVAKLQHDLAALASVQAQQKQALERRIEEIVAVHTQVANGHLSARVPFTSGMMFWQLAGPLNTLLGRYQRARQAEAAMQQVTRHLTEAQQRLCQEIAQASAQQRPLHLPPDPVLAQLTQALQGKQIVVPPPSLGSRRQEGGIA